MIEIGQIMVGAPRLIPQDSVAPSPVDPSQVSIEIASSIIEQFAQRLAAAERRIVQKVDGDGVIAAITMTNEDILITANQIGIVGQVTFADYIRDQSGNPVPGLTIDPKITRIIGDKIQTGKITSNNWNTTAGSQLDLDGGTIKLGGSSAPKFSVTAAGVMTCVDAVVTGTLQAGSVITGSVTIGAGGSSLTTVAGNASTAIANSATAIADAAAAVAAVSAKLEAGTSYTLAGVVNITGAAGAMKVGDLTWNSTTGAITGGSGFAFTKFGIIGAKAGVSTGVWSNAGDITIAGGATFGGNVETLGHVKASGTVSSSSGLSASLVGEQSDDSSAAVIGYHSGANIGGFFVSVGSYGTKVVSTLESAMLADSGAKNGVLGWTRSSSSSYGGINGKAVSSDTAYGVIAEAFSADGNALKVIGKISRGHVDSAGTITVYDTTTHAAIATYEYSFE